MRTYNRRTPACLAQCSKTKPCGNCMWYVDFFQDGRRIRKKIGRGKDGERTAKLSIKKIEVQTGEGRYLDVKRENPILFEDFVNQHYLPRHANKKRWYSNGGKYILPKIIEFFGKRHMHHISSSVVQEFKEKMETKAPVGVNRALTALHTIFEKAETWNELRDKDRHWTLPEKNPVKGIDKNDETERKRWASVDEIKRMLRYSARNQKLWDFIVIALNTGLRRGEILGIRKCDLDFVHNVIVLPETKSKSAGATDEDQLVPMNRIVRPIFARLVSSSKSEQPLAGNPRKAFENMLKRTCGHEKHEAGQKCTAFIQDFHMHDMRRTFATILFNDCQVDLFTISELLRHAVVDKIKITTVYTKVVEKRLHEAVAKLADYFEPIINGTDLAQTSEAELSDGKENAVTPERITA